MRRQGEEVGGAGGHGPERGARDREAKYAAQDARIQEIFAAIRALMQPHRAVKRRFGFRSAPSTDSDPPSSHHAP